MEDLPPGQACDASAEAGDTQTSVASTQADSSEACGEAEVGDLEETEAQKWDRQKSSNELFSKGSLLLGCFGEAEAAG